MFIELTFMPHPGGLADLATLQVVGTTLTAGQLLLESPHTFIRRENIFQHETKYNSAYTFFRQNIIPHLTKCNS